MPIGVLSSYFNYMVTLRPEIHYIETPTIENTGYGQQNQ